MQIDIEDFRVVTESYGMQLDDDMILATFSKVCPMQCCSLLEARLVNTCVHKQMFHKGHWHSIQHMLALQAHVRTPVA